MPSLVKLSWNILNVISEKKRNPRQDFKSQPIKEEKNATPGMCSFFTLYLGGEVTDLQVDERNQRKTWSPGEKKPEKHPLKQF